MHGKNQVRLSMDPSSHGNNMAIVPTIPATNAAKPRSRKSKPKWTKPKDQPKRPLSAYNLFFSAERKRLIDSGTNDFGGFSGLAQLVSAKWKSLDAQERKEFVAEAKEDRGRYKREMRAWRNAETLVDHDQNESIQNELYDNDASSDSNTRNSSSTTASTRPNSHDGSLNNLTGSVVIHDNIKAAALVTSSSNNAISQRDYSNVDMSSYCPPATTFAFHEGLQHGTTESNESRGNPYDTSLHTTFWQYNAMQTNPQNHRAMFSNDDNVAMENFNYLPNTSFDQHYTNNDNSSVNPQFFSTPMQTAEMSSSSSMFNNDVQFQMHDDRAVQLSNTVGQYSETPTTAINFQHDSNSQPSLSYLMQNLLSSLDSDEQRLLASLKDGI